MPNGKPREGVPPKRLGTKARCDALIKVLNERRSQFGGVNQGQFVLYWFILNAAFTKESPNKPTQNVTESLAEQMEKYLHHEGYILCPRTTPKNTLVWGTFAETCEAIRDIKKKIQVCEDQGIGNDDLEVFVSTNLGHMPRVWLCWFLLKPKNWKVHFVLANHSFTFWPEYFQETFKFFQYFYRFLFKKW